MAGKKKDIRAAGDRSMNKQEDNNPPRSSTIQHAAGGGSGNAADVTPPLDVGPSSTPPSPRRLTPSKRRSGAGTVLSDKRQKTKVGESSSASGPKETSSTGQFICPHPSCGRVFTRRQGLNGHMHYHNKVRIDGRDDGVVGEGAANDVTPREQAKQKMISVATQLLSKLTKDDNLPEHGEAATVCGGGNGGGASSSSSGPAASRRVVPTRTHLEFDIYRQPRDGTFTSARLRLELDFDVDPPIDDPEPELGFDMNEDPPVDPEPGFDVNEELPPEEE